MSSGLINVYKEQIEDAKEKINGQILKLRRLPPNEKEKLSLEIMENLKKVRSTFKKFKKEVKMVPESEKDRWELKKKDLLQDLSKLTAQFSSAKEMADRNELLDDGPQERKAAESKRAKESKKNPKVEIREENGKKKIRHEALEEELFKDVFGLQNESLDIVKRLLNKADEASELATDTQQVLAAQREQLEKIDEEMDRLGGNITRAGREITSFMRRMATDVFILVLCAIATCVAVTSVTIVIICKFGVCKLVLNQINKARGTNAMSTSLNDSTIGKCFSIF